MLLWANCSLDFWDNDSWRRRSVKWVKAKRRVDLSLRMQPREAVLFTFCSFVVWDRGSCRPSEPQPALIISPLTPKDDGHASVCLVCVVQGFQTRLYSLLARTVLTKIGFQILFCSFIMVEVWAIAKGGGRKVCVSCSRMLSQSSIGRRNNSNGSSHTIT